MEFTEIVRFSEYIKGFGSLTLPLLFAMIVLQCHIPVLPFGVISSVCGFIYGFKGGTAVSWIGATVGSTIAFYLYRFFNLDNLARKILGERQRMPEEFIFGFVIIAHNIPVIPIAAANIIAALSKISTPKFVAASALGFIIPSLGFVAFGSGIDSFLAHPSYATLLPVIAILLMFYLLKKYSPKISALIQRNTSEIRESQTDQQGENSPR